MLKDWLKSRPLGLYCELKNAWTEREHLAEFQEFYDNLEDKRDIFYMFFTGGLLHWVKKTLELVPDHVNVVVLGSNLSDEELSWCRESLGRPFHHIRLHADDKTVWEFLFKTNLFNFGWLDIDCFVLNPRLFDEMTLLSTDTSINCAWSFTGPGGIDILLTYFLFVNVNAIRATTKAVTVSPTTYSYGKSRNGRPASYAYCNILTPKLIKVLERHLPLGEDGRPVYVRESHFYDTLQVYQLIAGDLGYKLRKVRSLSPEAQLFSQELIHVGKVSYYHKWKNFSEPRWREAYALYLQADFLVLDSTCGALPGQYSRKRDDLAAELARLRLPTAPEAIARTVGRTLAGRGAGEYMVSRILGNHRETRIAA